MTAPQVEEHAQIAVGVATAIAHHVSDVMPGIQARLQQGIDGDGIVAELRFRFGDATNGEPAVVCDLTFSHATGDTQKFLLTPSAATGQLSILEPATPMPPPGMNGGNPPQQYTPNPNQYPAQQAQVSQPPPPMAPQGGRQFMSPPDPGQQLIAPPLSAVSGPIPQAVQPPAQQYVQPQQPQYQQQQPAGQLAQAQPLAPVRLRRPPMPGDENIR